MIAHRQTAQTPEASTVIQTADLSAARAYFVPTHPRVTTTIRFPREIGAPDGSVAAFTEDATQPGAAEYLVTWQPGDAYFTIAPLKPAQMANLNVPYQGQTYVFYFYGVPDPLQAVASVNLCETATAAPMTANPPPVPRPPVVTRQLEPPADERVPLSPARLVGFMDRLKLLHATPAGPPLASIAQAMGVDVALSQEESGRSDERLAAELPGGGVLRHGLNDAGVFQLVLLRAVRDRRLGCLGFICLVRNTSDHVLAFDVSSFGARAGSDYLPQRLVDAAPILKPGEVAPAYFIVQPARNSPLSVTNDWVLSVDLVSPRLNPGAAITRGFRGPAMVP